VERSPHRKLCNGTLTLRQAQSTVFLQALEHGNLIVAEGSNSSAKEVWLCQTV
jgi:hypothetical protein